MSCDMNLNKREKTIDPYPFLPRRLPGAGMSRGVQTSQAAHMPESAASR